MIEKLLIVIAFLSAGNPLFAQYTLNGSASKNDCHCYTLTTDAFSQTGSIWNNNKIDLTQSFDFKFDVFLGCADNDGADGIAFVLQPISTSVGSIGSGLGYSGVNPSVGVTIDTWQNGSPTTSGEDGDPSFDHIAIQINGDLNHRDSIAPLPINNLAGPVTALAGSDNIEDCQWHILRIQWDAPTKTLSAYVDGVFRLSTVKDFTADVFGGNPSVFWGFTGSTGGAKNLQQMCTTLKPVFRLLPGQKKCIGEKITFYDSTISFSPVQRSYWSFGDGSPIDSINVNPEHTYVSAGEYSVVQTVVGADGCIEVNTQKLTIGSVPTADFTFTNACMIDSAVMFTDASTASFGTIGNWFWDFGNGDTGSIQRPSKVYATPGFLKVRLAVRSIEGCLSDTIEHMIQVYEKPVSDFSFTDNQCMNSQVQFKSISLVNDSLIGSWRWNIDSATNAVAYTKDPAYTYNIAGEHTVSLVAQSINGCTGNVVTRLINILPQPVAHFNNAPICLSAPAIFFDSSYSTGSNIVNGWWWNLGNGVISIAKNSKTRYDSTGEIAIQLVVRGRNGCISDTLKKIISIESVPVARFVYNLPLCENRPVQFTDSSIINAGTIHGWSWIFDNGNSAITQDAAIIFPAGNHRVKLVVENSDGCKSDTVAATIFINPRPVVNFTLSNACENTAVSFNGITRPGAEIALWKWNFDDGTSSAAQDTLHTYKTGGDFMVELFAVSSVGCTSDTTRKNITIYATNAFAGNDTVAAVNQPIQLQASGGSSYEWRPAAGLSSPNIFNPVAINGTDRNYILRAFTPFGCESFDTIRIKIYDGPEIYVPKAFTPNGDGLNELLKALPVGVKQFKNFTVYNRLGQVVFFTSAPANGWDGTFKGKAQNPGVYIWTANAVGYAGNDIQRQGTAVLIR